jgi:glutaredoxin
LKLEIGENDPQQACATLYVVPGCPLCASARGWLRKHGVAYRERDVANDFGALRAMYKLTRQNLVPVFEFEGRALVRPSERELEDLLLSKS